MISFVLSFFLYFNDFSYIQDKIIKEQNVYASKINSSNLQFVAKGKKTTYLKSKTSSVLETYSNIYLINNSYKALLSRQDNSLFIDSVLDKTSKLNIIDFSGTSKNLPWVCFLCGIGLCDKKDLEIKSFAVNDNDIQIELSSKNKNDDIYIVSGKFSLDKNNFKILKYNLVVYRKDLKCQVSHDGIKLYKNNLLEKEETNTIYHSNNVKQCMDYNFSYPIVSDEEIDKIARLEHWGFPEINKINVDYTIYYVIIGVIILVCFLKMNSLRKKK